MDLREQLLAIIESGGGPPYHVIGPDGSPMTLMDDSLLPFILNPNPLPFNESLEELFATAQAVRVREILEDREILLEEADPASIKALAACMRLKSDQRGSHCMTFGDYFLEIDGQVSATLNIIGPDVVRWDERWHGDGELEDGLIFATWFAERGLDKLLRRHEKEQADRVVYQKNYDHWKSRMPCLETLWPEFDVGVRRGQQDKFLLPALELLSQACVTHARILRALFEWYGCYASMKGGTTQYETFVGDLLRTAPLELYVEVLKAPDISTEEWNGAIRSFNDRAWGWREEREAYHLGNLLLSKASDDVWEHLNYSVNLIEYPKPIHRLG
jgi:hypothetical protein